MAYNFHKEKTEQNKAAYGIWECNSKSFILQVIKLFWITLSYFISSFILLFPVWEL
jgi:hypothetical protein